MSSSSCDILELDKLSTAVYAYIMVKFVRIFVFALLTAFAVSSVAHATSSTTMSIKMALAGGGAMDMADCQGCGTDTDGEDSGPTCDIVCTVSFAASLGQIDTFNPHFARVARPLLVERLAGRTGLPEPYPPRTLI